MSKKGNVREGPGPSTITYKGKLNVEMKEDKAITANLGIYVPIVTAGVSGTITWNSVYNADPTGLSDWGDWKALYQEFRVLGMEIKYVPAVENVGQVASVTTGTTAVSRPITPDYWNPGPLMIAPYHGDATAFSTYTNAFNHYGVKIGTINKKLTNTVRMSEVDEAQFFSTSSGTAPTMGFKVLWIASCTGTDAPPVGAVFIMFTIQFRGRVATGSQFNKRFKTLYGSDLRELKSKKADTDSGDRKDKKESGGPAPGFVLDSASQSPSVSSNMGSAMVFGEYVSVSKKEYEDMMALKKKG